MNTRSHFRRFAAAFGLMTLAASTGRAQTYGPLPEVNYDLANYANSPFPSQLTTGNPLQARAYATDTAPDVMVVNTNSVLPAGQLKEVNTFAQPGSGPGTFNALVLRPTGNANEFKVVFDSGPLAVPAVSSPRTLTFAVGPFSVQAGDVLGHYGQGVPTDIAATGTDVLIYPIPANPVANQVLVLGSAGFPIYAQARTYSIGATIMVGGMRKFVDRLPGLGSANANNLGQYIPIAVADTTSFPNDDYYEIALVEYTEQMHSDLPATRLRGYVQLETSVVTGNHVALKYPNGSPILNASGAQVYAVDKAHYLGPLIVAMEGRPSRIKFTNYLPTGAAGDLFVPVDTTIMGAGVGPDGVNSYTQNRGTLHLHGGNTPWISDGTPHQWTAPAGEATPYAKGVSTQPVPDMALPSAGSMTFYYTNQQSGRLMFYHDHVFGLTGSNVYAGEAAGYLLVDPDERALSAGMPEVPLVIQDKTFVWGSPSPDGGITPATGTFASDPLWATAIPDHKPGDLWFPHVYMPNQDPTAFDGGASHGRWDYGPWFWPIFPTEGPLPLVSHVPEAFMDTPVVNGTPYPYLDVQPTQYRFRILNACNDRFLNLQLHVADPAVPGLTEVKMVDFFSSVTWPAGYGVPDARIGGVPDPALRGPAFIQIGTEGGIMPRPAVINNIPVDYDYDRRSVTVLNVLEHALYLGTAERADVIVDFSKFAGKTVILYNDCPAPVPAGDTRVDYYTGSPDQSDGGGAPSTLPGYGPNTRTILQFRVAAGPDSTAPADDYNAATLAALQTQLPVIFAASQPPLPVPEGVYSRIQDNSLVLGPPAGIGSLTVLAGGRNYMSPPTVNFLGGGGTGATAAAVITNGAVTAINVTNPGSGYRTSPTVQLAGGGGGGAAAVAFVQGAKVMVPKAIQELFDPLGRMNATLGVELPFTTSLVQTTIPLGYTDPTTESFSEGEFQLWKITHNGVDTHAIHVHLVNAQLVNRVGWDNVIKPPESNEIGWKETIRMNPLEDIVIAVPADKQLLPFGVPESVRLLNPTLPIHSSMGFTQTNPATGNPMVVTNELANFGWEYVWHCHLLGHEENDMMRPLVLNVVSVIPSAPAPLVATTAGTNQVNLVWTDPTPVAAATTLGNAANEIGFRVERANGNGVFAEVARPLANATTLTNTVPGSGPYQYRVFAYNAAGESLASNVVQVSFGAPVPSVPTNLTATIASSSRITLGWTDTSNNETSFAVWRATNAGVFAQIATVNRNAAQRTATGGTVTLNSNGVTPGNTYSYYVTAVNASGPSGPSNTVTVNFSVPAAPTALVGAAARIAGNNLQDRVTLTWTDSANNEVTFEIQRAVSSAFLLPQSSSVGVNVTTFNQNISRTLDYYYRVRAVNAVGNSAWSNAVLVTTP